MAIHPYLFTLHPVDTFFFGSERTFGYDGERSGKDQKTNKDLSANYFVESNRYPQQTTLLGVLRYKLLEAKGWLATREKPVPAEAKIWIGERSFQPDQKAADSRAFGYIHGLSPLFWLQEQTSYVVLPKDWGMSVSWQTANVSAYLGEGIQPNLPSVEGYKAKDGLPTGLLRLDGNRFPFDYETDPEKTKASGPYVKQMQEGILKKDQRSEDEQGFYKQTYYRFAKPDWSFAFFAYLDEQAGSALMEHLDTNGWATLGGEGRPFRLTMTKADNPMAPFTLPNRPETDGRCRITLLSDAYVPTDIYNYCDFAISETVDFRPIETSVAVRNYADLNRSGKGDDSSPKRGRKLQLLQRGSVFYARPEQLPRLRAKLDQYPNFQRIGYNAYHVTSQPPFLFNPN